MGARNEKVELNARIIEGFQSRYLWQQFDEPDPIADFHREVWADCCDPKITKLAVAAPRNHAKSTAFTHTFTLAAVCFRVYDYVAIVADTEGQAAKFLGDIKAELLDNDLLRRDFKIKGGKFPKDTDTEVIVEFEDGAQFNISAKGSEQKLRGLKWNNRRPNLVICDDLENDEIVMNLDRRKKFKGWFTKALMQMGKRSKRGSANFIVVGTILHYDSLLQNLMDNKSWTSRLYKAHASYNDFSEILWPGKFTEEMLREMRQEFVDDPDGSGPDGYAQEYLNEPASSEDAYFQDSDFKEMTEQMRDEVGLIYITNDIAVSVSKKADYTCHIVWKILASNKVCVIDVRYKRQDALKTCELMLDLNTAYEPEEFITESGVIEKTIGPFLNVMMLQENNFLTLETVPSSVDIERRASSLQARMRAGQVYFDTHADWFYEFKQEYLKFPRAPRNDRVAAGAVFGQRMALLSRPVTRDEDWEEEITQWQRSHVKNGRSKVTGY